MSKIQEKWFALDITVDELASEAVEFALNELESLGTEIDSLGKKKTEQIDVVGYFNEKPSDQALQFQLNEALRIYGFKPNAILKTSWREVENEDWLHEWKKHWKPTITEKFIIAPPWETVENTDKIVIRIEPNMAFGTGTHETTKLCLRAIEKYYEPEMSFFDLGTGTGILSIAVGKLQTQPQPILACDTDEDSIKIARENAILNETGKIEFYVGSISENTPTFDFVCANVTADVITPLLPLLIEKAEKILVLSGILAEQELIVSDKLREFEIEDFEVNTDGEWLSYVINR